MKFSIKDFFSNCDQIRKKLRSKTSSERRLYVQFMGDGIHENLTVKYNNNSGLTSFYHVKIIWGIVTMLALPLQYIREGMGIKILLHVNLLK